MSSIRRHTVLLVDDHELTRGALRLMLSGNDFEVAGEAGTGRSGLETAIRLRPEIVCLDIEMPDGNGLDILRDLREALPGTAVVMVTISNDRASIQSAIEGGAAAFIIKPFTSATVEAAMKKAVASLPRREARPA